MEINHKTYTDKDLFNVASKKITATEAKALSILSVNLRLTVLGYEAEYPVAQQEQIN